jgi:hypothetical protein
VGVSLRPKSRRMGLGSLNTIGLGEARESAKQCRELILAARDPIEERNAKRGEHHAPPSKSKTFEQCAVAYIASHEAGWRNAKHRAEWRTSLRDFAYPVFGALLVDRIDTGLVMQALAPLWPDKTETGMRVRNRIEAILDWARVNGYRSGENPARWRGHLDPDTCELASPNGTIISPGSNSLSRSLGPGATQRRF